MLNFIRSQKQSLGALGVSAVVASALFCFPTESLASISQSRLPAPHTATARDELLRDQKLSEQMTELRVAHETAPDFDSDFAKLSSRERQYRERLPELSRHPRLRTVVTRIAGQPYRPSHRR